jgi:hypothetical protein
MSLDGNIQNALNELVSFVDYLENRAGFDSEKYK